VIIIIINSNVERYSEGAMTQMYAKGPEDVYLTVGTDRNMMPLTWEFPNIWNIPNRYYLNDPFYNIYGYGSYWTPYVRFY